MNEIVRTEGYPVQLVAIPGADDLLQDFLAGKNARTLVVYKQALEDFRGYLNRQPEAEGRFPQLSDAIGLLLSCDQCRANLLALRYKADLKERLLSPLTVNIRLAALRSLVKMARTVGIVTWELVVANEKARTLRDTRGPGQNGVRSLMRALDRRHGKKTVRDRAILHLLYDVGLRRAEVVSLDWEHLNLEAGSLSIMGKGRVQRQVISIPEPTKAALRAWLELRGIEAGPLFTNCDRAGKGQRLTASSLYRNIRRLGKDVGLKVTPHGLRHSAITEACRLAQANGIDLEEVCDFSRHSDVSTLMIYRDRERNVQGQLATMVAEAL
ncbi:MAG TPA: tyrosine-type recombinase/integrase [Candidatus Brocadiia bacterium]|nr:tyrosine-type recombinase/integrase [Candidatus Brocadiia bacterium]